MRLARLIANSQDPTRRNSTVELRHVGRCESAIICKLRSSPQPNEGINVSPRSTEMSTTKKTRDLVVRGRHHHRLQAGWRSYGTLAAGGAGRDARHFVVDLPLRMRRTLLAGSEMTSVQDDDDDDDAEINRQSICVCVCVRVWRPHTRRLPTDHSPADRSRFLRQR